MRHTVPLVIVAVAALASGAAADDGALAAGPTVIAIPTAWTQPRTSLTAALDADHRGGTGARITLGYARLVEVDLRGDGELTACDPCAGPDRAVEPVQLPTAGWKLALRPWRDGAVAVGVRVPLGERPRRASEAFVVVSQRLGPVRLHAGASTWASEHPGATGAPIVRAARHGVRPLAGLEWTPAIYPRTTILADLQWLPELGPTAAETAPRWSFAWGVRYRALAWSAIELAVRHRQEDELGGATVMVRLSAAWPRAAR